MKYFDASVDACMLYFQNDGDSTRYTNVILYEYLSLDSKSTGLLEI